MISVLENINASRTTMPEEIEETIGLALTPRKRSILEASYPAIDAPNIIKTENQTPPRKINPTTIGSAIEALRSRAFKRF